MAAKIVRFEPETALSYGAPAVATRERWEDLWTDRPHLYPLEATWSMAPAMPAASLVWRYGPVLHPGATAWSIESRAELAGHYVRIRFPAPPDADGTPRYRDWYGILELDEDSEVGGRYSRSTTETAFVTRGRQTYTAFGLELLLAHQQIRTSWINDSGTAREIGRPLTFNRGGKPNRTAALIGTSHVFEGDRSVAQYWSTRDVVEYLLARCIPLDVTGDDKVPFRRTGPGLPDWDRPFDLEQDQATVYSLLNQLITRQFLQGWRLTVSTDITPNYVNVEVISQTESDIVLPVTDAPTLVASKRLRHLVYDRDPGTIAQAKRSRTERYDRVIVRGARKRSVGTFSYGDGTLTAGWSSTLEVAYETAASVESGYSSLDDEEKRRRDAEARSNPRLEEVFAFFKIPDSWNRQVKDGAGGTANPFFPDGVGGSKYCYFGELFVLPTLPFIQGLDYSGTTIEVGTPETAEGSTVTGLEYQPPIVAFKRPGTTRWVAAEKIGGVGSYPEGDDDNLNTFSVSVQVPHESRGLMLRAVGAPQHAIAPSEFAALPVDEPTGDYSWRNMVVTLALAWDEHVEGIWPAELPADVDAPRVRVIDAGDRYHKDYVAPGTVVAIHSDGTLLRSTTGGWIPKEGDGDDETFLTALAKIAFSYFGAEHYVLQLATQQLPAAEDLDVGDLITEIGDPGADGDHRQTINTVVTEVRIVWPESEAEPRPPQLQLVTDAGELDPIQTFGDPTLRWRAPKIEAALPSPSATPIVFA